MKLFLTLILLFPFVSHAEKFNIELNLNSLQEGYNAGLYEVTVETLPFQSTALAKLDTDYNDEEDTCISSLTFPVGAIEVTLKNNSTGEINKYKRTMISGRSLVASGDKCETDPKYFIGQRSVFVAIQPPSEMSFKLPLQIEGFRSVMLDVYPFVTTMSSTGMIKYENDVYLMEPQNVIGIATANKSTNVLSYRVVAENPGELYYLKNHQVALVPVK